MWWYYLPEGQPQQGPVAEEDLRRMVRDGTLHPNDLVWRDGMPEWRPAAEVAELFPAPLQASPAPPPPAYGAPPVSYPTFQGAGGDVPNHLPVAIAVTILCCVPMGIGAIIYAVQANSAKERGDLTAARKAAEKAQSWIILAAIGGLVGGLLYTLLMVGSEM